MVLPISERTLALEKAVNFAEVSIENVKKITLRGLSRILRGEAFSSWKKGKNDGNVC